MQTLLNTISRHWISIILVTTLLLGASVAVTALQPFEYRSTFSLLLIEKSGNLDAFGAAKSAERASLSLGQILYTTAFFDQVKETGLLDPALFPDDEQERRRAWERQIETRVFPDVGMVKISSYDTNQERANTLSYALATVLAKNGADYLGGGRNIVLKVVDAPLTSKTPVRPNVPMNLALGFLVGFGGSVGFHLVRESQREHRVEQQSQAHDHAQVFPATEQYAQAPAQRMSPPPLPVITTVFTPQAVSRIREQQRPAPQQQPSYPAMPQTENWQMPDLPR